jgi:septal ring factor EnvC (AmiA/AmiB activator)
MDSAEPKAEVLEGEDLLIDEDLRSFEQDDMVKAALAKGVDLRQYAKSVDDELRQVERDSIVDYIHEAEELATLHTQIKQCDSILDNMESMLSGFQGDLANISKEIKNLQDESISINIRLRNRKAVEGNVRADRPTDPRPPSLPARECRSACTRVNVAAHTVPPARMPSARLRAPALA